MFNHKSIIVFDLDGTLRDPSHRIHHISNGNSNWDDFFKACENDPPIRHMIENVRHLFKKLKVIEIWSGSSDIAKHQSLNWLANQGIINSQTIGSLTEPDYVDIAFNSGHDVVIANNIRFRRQGDYSDDAELKKSWLERTIAKGVEVEMVFDDRKKVVDMWREQDITCIQVAEGNF